MFFAWWTPPEMHKRPVHWKSTPEEPKLLGCCLVSLHGYLVQSVIVDSYSYTSFPCRLLPHLHPRHLPRAPKERRKTEGCWSLEAPRPRWARCRPVGRLRHRSAGGRRVAAELGRAPPGLSAPRIVQWVCCPTRLATCQDLIRDGRRNDCRMIIGVMLSWFPIIGNKESWFLKSRFPEENRFVNLFPEKNWFS